MNDCSVTELLSAVVMYPGLSQIDSVSDLFWRHEIQYACSGFYPSYFHIEAGIKRTTNRHWFPRYFTR